MSLRAFVPAMIQTVVLAVAASVLMNLLDASPEVAGLVFVVGTALAALLGVRAFERVRERRGPTH